MHARFMSPLLLTLSLAIGGCVITEKSKLTPKDDGTEQVDESSDSDGDTETDSDQDGTTDDGDTGSDGSDEGDDTPEDDGTEEDPDEGDDSETVTSWEMEVLGQLENDDIGLVTDECWAYYELVPSVHGDEGIYHDEWAMQSYGIFVNCGDNAVFELRRLFMYEPGYFLEDEPAAYIEEIHTWGAGPDDVDIGGDDILKFAVEVDPAIGYFSFGFTTWWVDSDGVEWSFWGETWSTGE